MPQTEVCTMYLLCKVNTYDICGIYLLDITKAYDNVQ